MPCISRFLILMWGSIKDTDICKDTERYSGYGHAQMYVLELPGERKI